MQTKEFFRGDAEFDDLLKLASEKYKDSIAGCCRDQGEMLAQEFENFIKNNHKELFESVKEDPGIFECVLIELEQESE